ncbi:hypothetical protein EPUS_03642 [Endocarpon pusillum Z07020]|uniref:Fido domain-containing protein n=1 Tax=Endocarpon pusillum (strain Z07020 / HMAS-L-300199) TaxID=1263415 RepID=U1HHN0_ENDPU|nr:uncharacterized protein EPUS_03642 [Endocarpon pusillum Z07020]ERF69650.1 hypothetical protein EPUS_03642 [Endocarpon pusillum Z07020]
MATRTISSPSASFRFLTTAQVLRLHSRYINPSQPAVQPALLDSATHAPVNTLYFGSANQHNVFYLAANLAQKLMLNHPFQDGNKRTSLLTARVFLRINGYQMKPMEDGPEVKGNGTMKLEDAIVGTVTKRLDVGMLKEYFEAISEVVEK